VTATQTILTVVKRGWTSTLTIYHPLPTIITTNTFIRIAFLAARATLHKALLTVSSLIHAMLRMLTLTRMPIKNKASIGQANRAFSIGMEGASLTCFHFTENTLLLMIKVFAFRTKALPINNGCRSIRTYATLSK
jgi:hypothetical protein